MKLRNIIPRKVKWWWLDFRRGIASCRRWFPVIWRDNTFDYGEILDILRHKLQMNMESIEKTKFYVGWETDVVNMKEAIRVLDRVIADDYFDEERENGWPLGSLRQADLAYFFHILNAHLFEWWW